MSSPDDLRADRVPVKRAAFWLLIALVLLAGVGLFLRYGRAIAPVLGGDR